jgi:hypothetical protein
MKPESKREYQTPELVVYGDIAEITEGVAGAATDLAKSGSK